MIEFKLENIYPLGNFNDEQTGLLVTGQTPHGKWEVSLPNDPELQNRLFGAYGKKIVVEVTFHVIENEAKK